MSIAEDFTLVSTSSNHRLYDDFEQICSAKLGDLNTSILKALRLEYPELCVTVSLASNVNLLQFAAYGNAIAELDIKTDSVQRLRFFLQGNRRGVPDQLAEARSFAKYHYRWGTEHFIVYIIREGYLTYNYILKEPAEDESIVAQPKITDALINAVGTWQKSEKYIYVYDYYWRASRPLWEEVEKASWDDVILNEDMKKTLLELTTNFFDSKEVYDDLGVPWKRGVIFYGPAGNGKTISIKALMHSLSFERKESIPTLYVKAAPCTFDIRSVFSFARTMSPCMLVLEDIDTIVTPSSRSYFFNEVDGLENNDGIFMVASTNHLDQLDPGLSSRPSRFDRKYLFPLPSEEERVLYCNYWREKLKNKPSIEFPKKLCVAIAGITQDFSFAYLKEAFVATLLTIANKRSENTIIGAGKDSGDLDDYELWREMKKTVKILRDDMGSRNKRTAFGHMLAAASPTPPLEPAGKQGAGGDCGLPSHFRELSSHSAVCEHQSSVATIDRSLRGMSLIADSGRAVSQNAFGTDILTLPQQVEN